MIQTIGKAYETKKGTAVVTDRPPVDNLSDDVIVIWNDKRQISPEQRRKAWALVGEVQAWAGYYSSEKEQLNRELKRQFLMSHVDTLTAEVIRKFSLGDCSMDVARLYISFLIEFCLEHEIPMHQPLIELADDIQAYIYACVMNQKCAVCGLKSDLHHCEGSTVGMGRNRNEIVHEGLEVMPLCRIHHEECHSMGQDGFNRKYHLDGGITADKRVCKKYKLKTLEE